MRAFRAISILVLSFSLWVPAVAGEPAREEARLTAAMDALEGGGYETARTLLEGLVNRVEARMLMHVIHHRGLGVAMDPGKAQEWFDFPREWPDVPLPNRVLALFWRHKVGFYGPETALKVFGERAKKGDAEAMYFIGEAYEYLPSVLRDYEKAVHWYRKSAETGYARAYGALAFLYFYGDGVQEDHGTALEWAERGGKRGDVFAQRMAGKIRSMGAERLRDLVEAYAWYKLVWLNCGRVGNGGSCPEDKEDMAAIESLLGPAEITHGDHLARKWRQPYSKD